MFSFEEFRHSGHSSGGGYPGVCDLIVKWVEIGVLDEGVLH